MYIVEEKALEKCITEIKITNRKLYISAIIGRYDLLVLKLAMGTKMKATLCEQTLDKFVKAYPQLHGARLFY